MNKELVRREVEDSLLTLLGGLVVLGVIKAEPPKKAPPTKPARKPKLMVPKLRGVKRFGPNKTQLMMNVLKDGKAHPASQLALAGGTSAGHVHTHLASRVRAGFVEKTGPGLFRLNGKKRSKAA